MKKKSLALLLALVLILGVAAGGTVAWLATRTTAVTNVFTTSDIDITLAETATDFKMVPGATIAKDPKVTVLKDSEKCYLFVKVEESSNFASFLGYEMADGWTALTGVTGVYYRIVEASTADQAFSVLKNDQVTVLGSVTKTAMNALTATTNPTLTFTAYASQYQKDATTAFTPAEAWANVPTT